MKKICPAIIFGIEKVDGNKLYAKKEFLKGGFKTRLFNCSFTN